MLAEQDSGEQREQPASAQAGCHPTPRVPGPRVPCSGLPSAPGAAAAPPGDTFIWEVAAVQLRKPDWRLPPPHRRHFPVPKTTMPRPLGRQPHYRERLLLSDRQHVLPLWLPACREAGVGRKTTPEKPGRPLCGAGQGAGGCRHMGTQGGCSCSIPPCAAWHYCALVCSARPSGIIPVGGQGGELWA